MAFGRGRDGRSSQEGRASPLQGDALSSLCWPIADIFQMLGRVDPRARVKSSGQPARLAYGSGTGYCDSHQRGFNTTSCVHAGCAATAVPEGGARLPEASGCVGSSSYPTRAAGSVESSAMRVQRAARVMDVGSARIGRGTRAQCRSDLGAIWASADGLIALPGACCLPQPNSMSLS
jgi:hypothetical protein